MGSQVDRRVTVGIIADPGVPTEIAERLAEEIPDELRSRVAEEVDWRVVASSEELPLGDDGAIDIAEKVEEKGSSEHWDLLVCLTDLPRIEPAGAVVADADTSSGAALASVPAIGWIRLLPYARRVVVHLVGLLAGETLGIASHRESDGYHAGAWGVFGVRIRQVRSSDENIDSNLQQARAGTPCQAPPRAARVRAGLIHRTSSACGGSRPASKARPSLLRRSTSRTRITARHPAVFTSAAGGNPRGGHARPRPGRCVMKYDEFIATVRRLGEYESRERAEHVTRCVLGVLGARITAQEAEDLAAQLPGDLPGALRAEERPMPDLSPDGFAGAVAARLEGASTETARWDVSAVLTTVTESIDGGGLNHVLSQLPSGFATFFGHPELA
jgi:uncharacterized protein (DUF2267 family)